MTRQEIQMRGELSGSRIDREPTGEIGLMVLAGMVHQDPRRPTIEPDEQSCQPGAKDQHAGSDKETIEYGFRQMEPESLESSHAAMPSLHTLLHSSVRPI